VLVAPAGIGLDRRESASFQGAVGGRPLLRSSAKRERVEGLHGQKVVGAFAQIAQKDE